MKATKEKKDEFINKGSEIEKFLLDIFGKDDYIVIADIGSCDGLSTIIYSKLFPNAEFLCFEPVTDNCIEMIDNFKEYGIEKRCKIWNCALGKENSDSAEFWVSSGQANNVIDWDTGNKSSSLYRPLKHLYAHQWCKFKKTIVPVRRLDEINNNKQINFAHIDVQGAELDVLKGGEKQFSKVKLIWLEVSNIDLYAGQPLKADVEKYIHSLGFECIKDTCGAGKFGDMLWVRPS